MINTKKYIKDKGLVDTLLVGSRTKPIYLETLLKDFEQEVVKKLTISDVIHSPDELEPVLAKIHHMNELGLSKWYEVVYFMDGNWRSYSDSKTFDDGEKVVKWKYCEDCI